MVNPKPAANNDWSFQKVFGDGDFIAAGQLIIPPHGRKPSKGTKDNTYVSAISASFKPCSDILSMQIFYVIEGAVNLKVHETSLILATGGMFMVPRGNNLLPASGSAFSLSSSLQATHISLRTSLSEMPGSSSPKRVKSRPARKRLLLLQRRKQRRLEL